MRSLIATAVALVFAFAPLAHAQDAERQKLAEQLLTSMDMQATVEKSFEMVKQMIPAQLKKMEATRGVTQKNQAEDALKKTMDLVLQEMSWDKLKGDYISIYAETFTADELKGLVSFYESPIGKKLIEKQPALMQRSMQVSQKQMMTLMPKIQALTQQLQQPEAAQPAK